MLAITFTLVQLLLVGLPLASASPITALASPRPQMASKLAASHTIITITTPTPTTLMPPPLAQSQQHEQRDGPPPDPQPQQPRDEGFAVSPTASSNPAVTPTLEQAQAQTTEAPPVDPEANADLAREGYSQVTYYSCEKYATTTMCGWHVPVVRVTGAAPRRSVSGGAMGWALVVGALVGRQWW